MDMWAVSAFWLLWTLLLWTWRCVSFYSFGFIPGSVIVGLDCNSIFNKDSNVSTSSPTLIFWFCFVNSNHPIKCEVTSLCGFDLHNDVKHHFMCCWQLVYLWRNVCSMEKEMATHSSVLAWRIPGTAEPGGLPFLGSHRVGHDWSDLVVVLVVVVVVK